jgi:hypothetical protein
MGGRLVALSFLMDGLMDGDRKKSYYICTVIYTHTTSLKTSGEVSPGRGDNFVLARKFFGWHCKYIT